MIIRRAVPAGDHRAERLDRCGPSVRWPLLLRLVNKILADQAKLQPDITVAAEDLLNQLRLGGKLQVDQLTGAAGQQLDVNDPDQRRKAVRATIQASTS